MRNAIDGIRGKMNGNTNEAKEESSRPLSLEEMQAKLLLEKERVVQQQLRKCTADCESLKLQVCVSFMKNIKIIARMHKQSTNYCQISCRLSFAANYCLVMLL